METGSLSQKVTAANAEHRTLNVQVEGDAQPKQCI